MSKTRVRLAKDRLALLLMVPVIGLLGLSVTVVTDRIHHVTDAERSEAILRDVSAFANLVHELQIERGATSAFVAKRDAAYVDILAVQRGRVSRAWATASSIAEGYQKKLREVAPQTDIDLPDMSVGALETLRRRSTAENSSGNPLYVIDTYTKTINALLNSIASVPFANEDSTMHNQVLSWINGMRLKESAGLERATATAAMEKGAFSRDGAVRFQKYVAQQETYQSTFLQYASAKLRAMYASVGESNFASQVDDIRESIFASINGAPFVPRTSVEVFEVYTKKINALDRLTQFTNENLGRYVQQQKKDAIIDLLLVAGFTLLAVMGSFVALLEIDRRGLALEAANHMAQAANHAKSAFLSRMSHELRTPLNAVIGFSQFLMENTKDPLTVYQREYVTHVTSAGEHLLALVNDILDLAKLESGRNEISLQDIYPSAVIEDCVSVIAPLARKRAVTIHNALAEEIDDMVCADPLRLKQVVLNLLSNAVKYNREGGSIRVSSYRTVDSHLHISIADTGIGIPESRYAEVFEPFERLGADGDSAIEGTGIGLTITKHLVEQMGGQIGFDSKAGIGTTFWIELDLANRDEAIEWKDELSTGVAAIDADHKILIGLLNDLGAHGLSFGRVDTVLDELLEYTVYHFRREEALMSAYGYEHLASHTDLHAALTKRVMDLKHQWEQRREARLIHEIHLFLRSWLISHIMKTDKAAFSFARAKNADIDWALASAGERPNVTVHPETK